MHLAQDVDWK